MKHVLMRARLLKVRDSQERLKAMLEANHTDEFGYVRHFYTQNGLVLKGI